MPPKVKVPIKKEFEKRIVKVDCNGNVIPIEASDRELEVINAPTFEEMERLDPRIKFFDVRDENNGLSNLSDEELLAIFSR